MKHPPKIHISKNKIQPILCATGLVGMAAVCLALYGITGYFPLFLLGVIQALNGAVMVGLLLPKTEPRLPVAEEIAVEQTRKPGVKQRIRKGIAGLWKKIPGWYHKGRNGIVTAVIAVAVVAAHLIYWKAAPAPEVKSLGYWVPVVLVALLIVSLVLEKWCQLALADKEGEQSAYTAALLRSDRSMLVIGMLAQLLCAVTVTVKLLGLYDASWLLKILLGIVFVYQSVFIAFSLAVRVIRHELSVAPEFLIALPGIGGADMHILRYLEENTGITMRSLWSMRLIKKLLPAAVIGIGAVVWLSTAVSVVQSHQEGALYRFGKMQQKTLEPGLHLTLPWPMDKVEVYDTKNLQKVTIGYIPVGDQSNVWTEAHGSEEYRFLLNGYNEQADANEQPGNVPAGYELISINMQVEYRIGDLESYIKSAAKPEALLQAKAYEIVTARTSISDLESMLSTDRGQFAESFKKELEEKIAPYHTGITVENVILESIHPPVEVAKTYQRLISAGIDAQQLILMAEREAISLIKDAQNQKTAQVGDAWVQKYQAIANAESAVAEFMASAAADSAYRSQYRYYKYMNALVQAYSNAKLIIVGEGVDSSQIYLGSLEPEAETTEVFDDEFYPEED